MEKEFMNFEETMEFLDIKRPTLLSWVKTKKVTPARLPHSRKMYFFRDTIIKLLREGEGREYGYKKRGGKDG
jgi:predicted site-specific integrase-resolvase